MIDARIPLRGATAAFVAVAFAAVVADAGAQSNGIASRWQPWLGCWVPEALPTAVDSAGNSGPFAGQLVCVIPGETPDAVEVVNITSNRVVSHVRLEATGKPVARTIDDCTGWETGTWSADNHRIMLQSEYQCANGVERKENGLMAMSPDGKWVQVQHVSADLNDALYVGKLRYTGIAFEGFVDGVLIETPRLDENGLPVAGDRTGCTGSDSVSASADGSRVTVHGRYDCAGVTVASNATFVRGTDGRWQRTDRTLPFFSTATSRLAAGGSLSIDAVVEAAAGLNDPVVEAWLADRAEPMHVSGKDLVRLARRGVPDGVIDLLVALDNPNVLAFRTSTTAVAVAPIERRTEDDRVVRTAGVYAPAVWVDPWLSPWDPYGYRYRYGFVDVGYLYNYGLGGQYGCWGCYGYGYNGIPYGYGPVVITSRKSPRTGVAVAGQGYTRPASGASGVSRAIQLVRPSGSSSSAGRSTSRSGSSGGGAASGGGSSGSSGRTAKKRGT